MVPEITARL